MDGHPLSQHAAIDSYLTGARRALTAKLAAGLDLDAGLDAILGHGEEPPSRGRRVATGPDSSAGWAIWIRQRAWNQFVDLDKFKRYFTADYAALKVEQVGMREMEATMADWHGILSDKQRRAETLRRVIRTEVGADQGLLRAALVADLGTVTDALAEAMNLLDSAACGLDLDSVVTSISDHIHLAARMARALVDRVLTLQVDASGADLSSLARIDMSLLAGVVWTDETLWPPFTDHDLLRARSADIAPGVYQVTGGNERDRSDLVTR